MSYKRHRDNDIKLIFSTKYQRMKRLLSLITLVVVTMCCYAEQKIYVVDGFKYLADPDTKEATLIYNENKYSGDVVIPASFTADGIEFKVTALGDKCFYVCSGLKSVSIPEGVKSIGKNCFFTCGNLKSVTIPHGVNTIGENCFNSCHSLTSISIPSSITYISDGCFFGCDKLTSIILPSSIKSMYYCCFSDCTALSSITCLAPIPPAIINGNNKPSSFSYFTPSTCILYVPDVDAYKAATAWKDFPYIYKIKEGGDQPSEKQQCEKPIISFANGKLLFSDATKGAEYHYTLTCADVKTNEAIDNGIVDLAACYNIEVYATAEGYRASDNATATLFWVKDDGKIGTDINTAKTRGLVVSSDQGLVTCSGLNDGEQALFYNAEGKLLGRQTAQGGSAGIATQEKMIIVKVGTTSLKVHVNQ